MSEVDERSLAEVAPEVTEDDDTLDVYEDVTNLPEPEDYDFGEFVQGVRPTRRAVVLYQRNDVRADLDLLDDKIEIMRKAGEDTAEQEELRAEVATELLGSGQRVIVEARSSDWVKAFMERMKTEHDLDPYAKKLNPDKKQPEAREAELVRKRTEAFKQLTYHQIAEQIVYPKTGVTAAAVAQLAENSEVEVNKIYEALGAANRQPGVTPDFSQRPSGRRATRTG